MRNEPEIIKRTFNANNKGCDWYKAPLFNKENTTIAKRYKRTGTMAIHADFKVSAILLAMMPQQ
jgi:hypothetical protein